MAEYAPNVSALTFDMVTGYGFLQQPPIVWFVTAEQLNNEASSTIENGRYLKHKGVIQGNPMPTVQDTTLASGKNTGRTFTSAGGTWRDDAKAPGSTNWRLMQVDGDGAVAIDIIADDTTDSIESAIVVIGHGVTQGSLTTTPITFNTYLELAYGSSRNYRIAMEANSPIALQYTEDSGATWRTVQQARDLGNLNTYLNANNHNITLQIIADPAEQSLTVEIGNGAFLTHKVTGQDLPSPGRPRLTGIGGWRTLEYQPIQWQPSVTVRKAARDFGQLQNVPAIGVTFNGLAPTTPGQSATVTPSVTPEGLELEIEINRSASSGGVEGATVPTQFADIQVVIPSYWTRRAGGLPDFRVGDLRVNRVSELEVWDAVTRCTYHSAKLTLTNHDSFYTNSFGHYGVNLSAASLVGGGMYQRMLGVAGVGREGISFTRQDPQRLCHVNCSDRSYVMGAHPDAPVTLGQEVILDGWCLYSAVRFLCELGNIDPTIYLPNVPYYVPPGSPPIAPYGVAGEDCPYPILPRGTGLNPRLKYLPERTPWSVLQELVQDAGTIDPYTGLPSPFYMGFDPSGNFHFEPVSFVAKPPVITYAGIDPSGVGSIFEIHVFNSVCDMRTSVDFQGLDAQTYELLYYHLAMPPEIIKSIGFRFTWLERDARYASAEYIAYIAQAAAYHASLPQRVVKLRVPFQPYVHAGDVCVIAENNALGGTGRFVIEEIASVYGADGTCESVVTCRALQNYF